MEHPTYRLLWPSGNSTVLSLSPQALASLGVKAGDEVAVVHGYGVVVVVPVGEEGRAARVLAAMEWGAPTEPKVGP